MHQVVSLDTSRSLQPTRSCSVALEFVILVVVGCLYSTESSSRCLSGNVVGVQMSRGSDGTPPDSLHRGFGSAVLRAAPGRTFGSSVQLLRSPK